MTSAPAQDQDSVPSYRRPCLFLGLALLWSVLAVVVLLVYHVPEPSGVLSVTTNGHTYFGHPPALTLLERDPVSFATVIIVLIAGLLGGGTDLALRFLQHSSRMGICTVVLGASVILVSTAGLLVGLDGVGVVGVLLVVSGLPARRIEN